jgi:two-component sensor histidine kinase
MKSMLIGLGMIAAMATVASAEEVTVEKKVEQPAVTIPLPVPGVGVERRERVETTGRAAGFGLPPWAASLRAVKSTPAEQGAREVDSPFRFSPDLPRADDGRGVAPSDRESGLTASPATGGRDRGRTTDRRAAAELLVAELHRRIKNILATSWRSPLSIFVRQRPSRMDERPLSSGSLRSVALMTSS